MPMSSDGHRCVTIRGEPDIATAILQAKRMTQAAEFDTVDQSRIATAVSELARNILKYAGHGEVQLRPITDHTRRGMEVVATDNGPGIADTDQALADHYSSSGTLGLGLPGVQRMMDEFDLESAPGAGTRVTIRKWR
jgi:serine/threonine-protein kinase RsbT